MKQLTPIFLSLCLLISVGASNGQAKEAANATEVLNKAMSSRTRQDSNSQSLQEVYHE